MKFFWLIIFFLLTSLGVGGVKFFLRLKQSVFWSLKRVNLIILSRQSGKAAITSFAKKTGRVFFLPEEKLVMVPRGFGQYKLGNVFALGELEKKGGQLIEETIRENFYLPVWGYFSGESIDFNRLDDPSKLRMIFWLGMKKNIQTNLSFGDLLLLFIRTKKISEFSVVEKFWENQSEEYFTDSGIRDEAIAVEILNATKHDGLAQKVSRLWENIGGRVVRIADSDIEGQFGCRIAFASRVKESYSLRIMKEIYGCEIEEVGESREGRVDLSLMLGEDYWKKIEEKW